MSIRARINGEDIFSFKMDKDSWHELKASYKEKSLLMPCCDSKAIPKVSKLNNYFFAHSRKGPCSSAPETPEHIYLKTLIAKQAVSLGWDVVTERTGETPNGEQWIADVFCTKGKARLALEVQWSSQTQDEFRRRQDKYDSSDVRAAWLYRLKNNKEYSVSHYNSNDDDLPYEHKIPVFGIKYRPDSKDLYVPQFDVSIDDFVRGMLQGKLKWSPIKEEMLIAKLIPYSWRCWKCEKFTKVILAVSLHNQMGKVVMFEDFGSGQIAEFIARHVNNQILASCGVGSLKSRYSKTEGRSYISNSCRHCNALMGNHFISQKSRYLSLYGEYPKPFMEFTVNYGEDTPKIKGDWYFEGVQSKSYF